MASLAVIALSKSEHRQLTELWRFFPFSGSTVYHYAHLGAAAPETLPQRPDFIARAFSGSAQEALPRINEWLAAVHGRSVAAHLGVRVREAIPDIAPHVEPLLRQVLETGEPI
ncbi:MAG TPA: hypothetical protein PKH19_05950, partial [Candidatus Syntrophosphaera sp.]|nr:hypothetical protein [Candidatus Syntrophosphaera sp.]